MIKVVVRHCNRTNTTEQLAKQQANQEENSSKEHKHKNKLLQSNTGKLIHLTPTSFNSSIVEIKYSRMSSSRSTNSSLFPSMLAQKSSQNLPTSKSTSIKIDNNQRREFRRRKMASGKPLSRPRGSLSSCSSSSPELSGSEELMDYFCAYNSPPGLREYSLSVFEDDDHNDDDGDEELALKKQIPRQQSHLNQVTDGEASNSRQEVSLRARPHNNLHTRSVSLIVNPMFSESPDSNQCQSVEQSTVDGLDQVVKYKRARHNSNKIHFRQISQCGAVRINDHDDKVTITENELIKLKKEFREKFEAQAEEVLKKLHGDEPLNEAESSRLREIGFFLRQISDEFARNRRLTI